MSKPKITSKITKRGVTTTVKHAGLRQARKQAATAAKVAKVRKGLGVIVAVLKAGGGTIPEITAVHKKLQTARPSSSPRRSAPR